MIICINVSSFAYDHQKCTSKLFKPYTAGTTTILPFVTAATILPTSLGQLTSSTGPCSALALKQQRMEFFYVNKSKLLNDLAMGSGEYLGSYGSLASCNDSQLLSVSKSLQSQFGSLVKLKDEKQFEFVEGEFSKVCSNNNAT